MTQPVPAFLTALVAWRMNRSDMPPSSAWRRRLAAAVGSVILLSGQTFATEVEVLRAIADEPRAFGYSVGDVVTRHIALQVPAGLALDRDSLPRAGARGRALELQRVVLHTTLGGVADGLRLDYQVFGAPRQVRVLEMPPIELRFVGSPRPQTVRIDAWPVTVSPLAPVDAATREGLGELRPDTSPPLLPTAQPKLRLMVEAGAALLLLGYLAHVYLVMPWASQRRRPFGRAWEMLKALPARPDAAQRRAAFERIHAALNETAGQVLFAPQLDAFFARLPRFAPLRGELSRFFEHSRNEFFAPGGTETVDGGWLVALARRCRDLERGAA